MSDFFTRLATRLISPGAGLLWPATPSRFDAPPELPGAMRVLPPMVAARKPQPDAAVTADPGQVARAPTVSEQPSSPARRGSPALEVRVEIGAIELVSDAVVRTPAHTRAPLTLADYLNARGQR